MEKDESRFQALTFVAITLCFWAVRLAFIWLCSEASYTCEWRAGTVARELLTNPVFPLRNFLSYTCIGLADGWQLIEGAFLAPLFFVLGPSLLTLRLAAGLLSYIHFTGWYLLLKKDSDRFTSLFFGMLFAFAFPFYLEGSLFLVGTQVQSALFIPYVFLLIRKILTAEKGSVPFSVLAGFLTGFGLYFAYEYYILLFLGMAATLLVKTRSVQKVLAYAVPFLILIIPFLLYSFHTGERIFQYRGPESTEIIMPVRESPGDIAAAVVERGKDLVLRHVETYAYGTAPAVGIAVFLLILAAAAAAIRKKGAGIRTFALVILAVLTAGRILSAFSISGPIRGMMRGGSGRYFLIGFEVTLVLLAAFMADIRKRRGGRAVVALILCACTAPAIITIARSFDPALLSRSFLPGYDYSDLGFRLCLFHKGDFIKTEEIIKRKKAPSADRDTLIEGAFRAAVLRRAAASGDPDPLRIREEFISGLRDEDKRLFDKAFGEAVAAIQAENPLRLMETLAALEKRLPAEELRSIAEGVMEKAPGPHGLSHEDFLAAVRTASAAASETRNSLLRFAGMMKAVGGAPASGLIPFKEMDTTAGILGGLDPADRDAVLGGYYHKIISLFPAGDFRSLQNLMRLIKSRDLPAMPVFLNEICLTYEPLYGEKTTERFILRGETALIPGGGPVAKAQAPPPL